MIGRLFWGLAFWLICTGASALSSDNEVVLSKIAFPIPDKYQLVNDYLGVLTLSKSLEITKKLQSLEHQNGTQIVFLSVPSTGQLEARDYAIQVWNKWDIGNNGQGNGVLFLVRQDGQFWISTGAGIAGALPDVKIARIVRRTILPLFEKEKHAEAIEAAIDEMIKAARGEDSTPTFFYYLDATGAYFSPMLSFYERLTMSLTREQVLIGILILFGIAYAAGLFWHRRKLKKIAK
ncbi:MAG: TPM domain-containing protein [Burkholderiales bacterium]|nr:TPM domain-containing protein [Burkholderiales bacterium]